MMIESDHSKLSIVKQRGLLDVSRSGLYYKPVPESEGNLAIMRWMDDQYLNTPFHGVERLLVLLVCLGYKINRKRLRRLFPPYSGVYKSGKYHPENLLAAYYNFGINICKKIHGLEGMGVEAKSFNEAIRKMEYLLTNEKYRSAIQNKIIANKENYFGSVNEASAGNIAEFIANTATTHNKS